MPRRRKANTEEMPCRHDLAERDTESLRAEVRDRTFRSPVPFRVAFARYLREEPIGNQIVFFSTIGFMLYILLK